MGNFKNRLSNYQPIPRQLIFDKDLSDRARFVYCYMASKPEDWSFYTEPMANELGYSKETLRKYINELINSGWLVKGKQNTENMGRFGAVEYTLMEMPEKPQQKKPSTEITEAEIFRHGKNPALKEIDNKEKIEYIEKQMGVAERLNLHASDIMVDPKTFQKVDKMLSSIQFPFDDEEFIRLFFVLCTTKKWRNKAATTIQMQLKKISIYEMEFAKQLVENSMANEWQGLVYEDTPERYKKWKMARENNMDNELNEIAKWKGYI